MKRKATSNLSTEKTIVGLSACDRYLLTNDCASITLGIRSILLRKPLTDIFDLVAKRSHEFPTADELIQILIVRRDKSNRTDSSLPQRCLINRLISFIQQSPDEVMKELFNHRVRVKERLSTHTKLTTNLCQWENHLFLRSKVIGASRLFHVKQHESLNIPHIATLIDLTTCLLRNTINHEDILRIVKNSFVIVCQPQFNGIPVTIYQSSITGVYTVKINVRILSLLSDFIRLDPNFIRLDEIDVSLAPHSSVYEIETGRKLSWETYRLKFDSNLSARTIDCAETDHLTIRFTSRETSRVPFARVAHTLRYNIHFQMKNKTSNVFESHQCLVETMPFAIGNHNVQIPELLSQIIWSDIKSILMPHRFDMHWIRQFLSRYFINRTGVFPNEIVQEYLQSSPSDLHSMSDRILSDLILPFVSHVEVIAKNPLLALLHHDRLLFSPSNSIETVPPESSPILRTVRFESQSNSTGSKMGITIENYRDGQWSHQKYDSKKFSRPLATLIERQAAIDSRYRLYYDDKLTDILQSNNDFHSIKTTTDAMNDDDSPKITSLPTNDLLQYLSQPLQTGDLNLGTSIIAEYHHFDDILSTGDCWSQSFADISKDVIDQL